MTEQNLERLLETAKASLKELVGKSLESGIQHSTKANDTCSNEGLRMESIKINTPEAYERILSFFNSRQTEIKKLVEDEKYKEAREVVGSVYSEIESISTSVFPDKHTIELDAVRHWCTAVSGNLRILIRSSSAK